MKAFIFLSTDDLIDHLMEIHTTLGGFETPQQARDIDEDDEIYKKIYSQSMIEIQKYHKDYPYLQRTKKFGCWIV